jgi:CheY-like chemotaxis protein
MNAETQAKVFDPFFTTKDADKGTGLGLATVHGIVTQSGGAIDLQSAPNQGTTITIYLPRTHLLPVEQSATEDAASHGSETVLLVEDEDVVRNLLLRVLEAHGYQTIGADCAATAIDIEHRGERIDLLITDMTMPGIGGTELSEHLRARHPTLRTLFISGYTQDAQLYNDAEQGNTNFLQKPFSPNEFARRVRNILDADAHVPLKFAQKPA